MTEHNLKRKSNGKVNHRTGDKNTPPAERPKPVDVLVGVTEIALAYRYPEKMPTISDMARTVSTASRLLRFSNLDERIETENQAVLALARKKQLVS
ncbi:MAG: hypothetical protein ACLP19_23515 [Xanthobacteraceae bacterium]